MVKLSTLMTKKVMAVISIVLLSLILVSLYVYKSYFKTSTDFSGSLVGVTSPLILFDFDGVICNSYAEALRTMNVVFEKNQIQPLDLNDIEQYRAFSTKELLKQAEIPTYKILPLVHEWRALMQEKMASLETFKYLPEMLRDLKQEDYSLGIVTSNSIENVSIFLNNHQLDMFNFVFSGSGLWSKNTIFETILSNENIKEGQVYFIGDEARDIEAGHKANIPVIGVTWGFQNESVLSKHSPAYIANSVQELNDYIKKEVKK